ncbi:hypothetical protein BCR44DRAFT_1147652 [Catenaria anguillulae PL171]|uniref:Golgi-body localization protein domain-domain-containing protein n=1 Tax=Catenaria anguillulae PL171 TaxID=765915 RepID=A0A1Y2HIX5_9FUNG|nr:hypothetical protein BCR44DRAFT_1147652 [Catenaria anguillulae PL171]
MFRMLFAMQLKTLLGQFIMYTLVRWLDVLISRVSVRLVTTQPSLHRHPHSSLPSLPAASSRQATVEFIQDSLHLSGDLQGSALGAATAEPGSPRGSTVSLATGISSAVGGSTTAHSTIDVAVTFSPISIIVNSVPVVTLPQSSVLTVSFALTRPVPSFQRPSVDFTFSPISVNAPPALAFWTDHKSFFEAVKSAHALARPAPSHANASSSSKSPSIAQRLRKLGVHMHPLMPNVARIVCPRIQLDAPLDLGGTIQGLSLVCSFGSAWWDTTAVLTTTEWSVTHAKEVVEKLASFEVDVTIVLPDSGPGTASLGGGGGGNSSGSSSIRSREGTANRASLAANALSQKPLVQVEIKTCGLEARVKESLISSMLAHMAATAEAAKAAAVAASVTADPLSASGTTPTTPLLSPAPMSSRSPRASPFTLPALARRISRHASLNGSSRSRRITASDGGQEIKPLIPLAAREMLGLVDMEVTLSLHAVDVVVSPISGVDVCVSADQFGIRTCLAAVPMVEVDVSFSVDALCVRVMGTESGTSDKPSTDLAMWLLASIDILRLDGLITEVEHVPTHVHSATASIPPTAGDASMLDPWETQRFDVVMEGHAHHPHIALSATQSLAVGLARVMALAQDHHPTSPVSSAPPSRSMSISVDPPSRPLVALHSTAKFTVNRMSVSVSGEHRPEMPRTMSAEPGIDGSIDCLMITHLGKRILGGGGSLGVLLAVQALEVPTADSITGAMDTLHACRVDEMVVELDGIQFRRNQHCDVKLPPRYHGRNSGVASGGGRSPHTHQDVDPLLVASRVSLEHKVVDTAVRASSDMYPRLHRNVSTSVNVDEELVAVYSIPVHLLVEQLLVLLAIGTAKSPMTPPPEPKRPSITSLTGSIVESERAQATAGLVSFVFELPDDTKLKVRLSEVKAVMERHGNELYAQSNISSMAVLATQSASTRAAQHAHPSIFLQHPDPRTLQSWRSDPKQFAPLVNVSAIEVVRKPNQEVAATIENVHISVPHEYYFKDVIENFATFVKAIKPAKPPTGTTRTATMIYPTMRLEIQTLLFTIDDDPFEARLNQIFRNGKDQQRSRLEREKLLFNKLKTVPDLDHTAFWRELDAFHGREWVRIMSASAKEPMDKLLVFKLTEVDIVVTSPTLPLPTLAANCNLHDKDTPSDAQFDFELARDLSFRFRSMLVRLRDYPLPVIALPPPADRKQSHMLHGLLILAEPIAPQSSTCQVTVPVSTFGPQPFIHLRKIMSPIKIYSCLTWRLESPMTIHWGPALEAGLADAVRAIDQFTEPSLDPSEPMPWWDKIRWLLHGKLDIEGDALKLHLLGARNPYYSLFTSDGSHGIVVSAYGKRRMLPATFPGLPSVKSSSESLPFERPFRLSFSSSSPGLLQCAQLEVAIVRPLINHNAVPRRPTDDIVAIPWDSGPVDKEVIMNLMGEVMLSMDPVFECAGIPPSHHHVFAIAPENVKEGGFHDSFARFRSHRLSLTVHIRCDRTDDPSHFATFAFTPASIDYAIKFVQFNVITKTTPLRRGPLFPLTTPKYASKKLGLFTSRFALRVDLAPLLITLWHKNKAIQRPSDAVGMRAVVERCLIDFHTARFRSTDATNATPPWYIDTTEIDFFDVELRALVLSDTSSSDGAGAYANFEQREQVFVRLANSHASLSVKSTPFFWSPKLSYCRNSDVDYGREASFGRDINRVQLQLLKEYLASGTVAHSAKPAIQHRIRQLEQSDVYHLDQDDYVHSFVIHNSKLLWNVDIRNVVFKFVELQEQAFLLSYYTSNASLRIMRDLRELLDLRDEAEHEQAAFGDDRPTASAPFKPVLETLARRASSGAVLRVSTADLTQPAPGSTKDSQRILNELLDGAGSVFVSEEDVAFKPATSQRPVPPNETTHSTSSRNRAADLVIKSIMIQFINPQIKLCTVPLDDSPDGSCIVTTENTILTQNEIHRRGILIKTKTEVDISALDGSLLNSFFQLHPWIPLRHLSPRCRKAFVKLCIAPKQD